MKTALGILLVIAICYIFFLQLCKPPVKDSVSKAKFDSLQQRVKDTAQYYQELLKADSAAINNAHQVASDQYERSEVYRKSANEKQGTIDRLVAKIEAAKKEKPDSSWVRVSPNYVEGCDSLADQNKILKQANVQYQDENAEAHKLLLYEMGIRDSAMERQKEFTRKFYDQLENCMAQLKDKVGKKQPIQLYAGIGVLGNRINPIGGGQVNVSLRARNSQIYEVTGAMVGNTWYGGVGTKLLIRLRK